MPHYSNDGDPSSQTLHFQRKVYQIPPHEKESIQKTQEKAFSHFSPASDKGINRKDTPHVPHHRDVYFPLLIKIFSLQEQIRNLRSTIIPSFPHQTPPKTPADIYQELMHIQKEIEESQRWNEAVLAKVKKACIELHDHSQSYSHEEHSRGFFNKLKTLINKFSWTKKSHQ